MWHSPSGTSTFSFVHCNVWIIDSRFFILSMQSKRVSTDTCQRCQEKHVKNGIEQYQNKCATEQIHFPRHLFYYFCHNQYECGVVFKLEIINLFTIHPISSPALNLFYLICDQSTLLHTWYTRPLICIGIRIFHT